MVSTKLTWQQVQEIRGLDIPRGTMQKVADHYGVSKSLISGIRKGKMWRGERADDVGVWRPIPGFSRYEASDDGRIRKAGSLAPMKQTINDRGRYVIGVTADDGIAQSRYVHRLIALAFHGAPQDDEVVCHSNGDSADNRASNLRWDTASGNQLDAVRHGTHGQASKTHCPQGHPYDEANTLVRWVDGRKRRRCRICVAANDRKQWERRRREKRLYLDNQGGYERLTTTEGASRTCELSTKSPRRPFGACGTPKA